MASRDIERQLKEDEEKFKKISRLLLLGKFDFFFLSEDNAANVFVFDKWTRCVFCLFVNYVSHVCLQRYM